MTFEGKLLTLLALVGDLGCGRWAAVAVPTQGAGSCDQGAIDAEDELACAQGAIETQEGEEEEEALLQTTVVSGFSVRRVGAKKTAKSHETPAPVVAPAPSLENVTELWVRRDGPVVSVLGPWPATAGVTAANGAKLARAAWVLGCLLALCVMLVVTALASFFKTNRPSSEASSPTPVTPPPPAPRLAQCRTSFVIPVTRLRHSTATTFSFDIPVWPVVWPFRAMFWRPSSHGRWEMFEISVDVTAAAGVPQLLSCRISDSVPETEGHVQLVIQNTGGTVVAMMNQVADGFVVQREGQPDMQVTSHADLLSGFVIRKHGQDIGVAASFGSGKQDDTAADSEEYLQLDVQPDAESPEAALLLTCMLASIVFGPCFSEQGK